MNLTLESILETAATTLFQFLVSEGGAGEFVQNLGIVRDWTVPNADEPHSNRWLVFGLGGIRHQFGFPSSEDPQLAIVADFHQCFFTVTMTSIGWTASLSRLHFGICLPPALGITPVAAGGDDSANTISTLDSVNVARVPCIWGTAGVSLNEKVEVTFLDCKLELSPVAIGESGIILSASSVLPHFFDAAVPSEYTALATDKFHGLLFQELSALLPESLTFSGFDTLSAPIAAIGTGGFTGKFGAENSTLAAGATPTFNPATGTYDCKGAGKILGFAAAMRKITLSFQSSALTASEITAVLRLPGFDKDVEANAFLSLDGKLTVAVTNLQKLGTLKIDGIAEFTPESIVLSNSGDGPAFVSLAGKLTPLLQTDIFNWPTLDIRALRIDTAGNLSFDGGWLDLPKSVCLDLFGFQLEVTKIAFGSDGPSRKWFGLSGGVKLIDGMPAGASADGLRISWSVDASGIPVPGSFGFSFDGIGVAFEIPDVLKFSGSVAMKTEPAKPGDTRFEGAVSLDLLALGMTVDATVVFGRQKNQPYMGIYLAADIPSAMPLFSTGLGIYGIDALACLNMKHWLRCFLMAR